MKFLVFHLHGPLAAWGDIAVGEVRPSFPAPTRSALLGLLAAATGVTRSDQAQKSALANELRFAVRIDCEGSFFEEYQTISLPEGTGHTSARTRRHEILFSKYNTIQSYRGHYTDATYTVFVALRDAADASLLDQLVNALNSPAFIPFLGRKACPLDIPMIPRVISSPSLREALLSEEAELPEALHNLFENTSVRPVRRKEKPRRVIADALFDDWNWTSEEERNNEPGSRTAWNFSKNRVRMGIDFQPSNGGV